MRSPLLATLLLAALPTVAAAPRPAASVVPNDNRVPAGTRRGGVLELRLVARTATWRPTERVDSTVTVQVFAEE